jgi:hypothetical protein
MKIIPSTLIAGEIVFALTKHFFLLHFQHLTLFPSGLDNECFFLLFSWTSASSVSLQGLSFEAAGLKYA